MSIDLTKPAAGQPKKPGELRDNFQHLLGAALPDCILPESGGGCGGKITPGSGLDINYSGFNALIGHKYHKAASGTLTGLAPRKAQLLYARKNEASESVTPAVGVVEAAFPEADAGTVCRWLIDGSATIASTVGSNNLTKNGTVTQVDGWIGYGGKGDGSTGYYVSANSTGFPTGTSARNLRVLWTCRSVSINEIIVAYGSTVAGSAFKIRNVSGSLKFADNASDIDTGFALTIGQTYLIEMGYDGANLICLVNGKQVYKSAYTVSTTAGVLLVMRDTSANYYSNGIVHYVELRNVVPTEQTSAAISNALLLPCRYTEPAASYPSNPTDAGYHCWKFDDTSGTTVTDEAGTLNGTATGTTIVDSEVGLGKARKFASSDIIVAGSLAFSISFTIISVMKHTSFDTLNRVLFSNWNGSAGNLFGSQSSSYGKVSLYNGTWANSISTLPLNKTSFAAVSVENNQATFYVDSPKPDTTVTYTPNTTSQVVKIGALDSNNGLVGINEYLAYIPRALSQAEIAQYYNALMKTTGDKDIRAILPADSISLGFVRTSSSSVIEIDDASYKYGRREGATDGNRRVFLGWKYFNTAVTGSLSYSNPFATTNLKIIVKLKTNLLNDLEYTVEDYWVTYNTTNGGYQPRISTDKIILVFGAYITGFPTYVSSGYIGCYAEVIE